MISAIVSGGKPPSEKLLRKYINEKGKILPRRVTGACSKHQRHIAREVKRARMIALLPFTR